MHNYRQLKGQFQQQKVEYPTDSSTSKLRQNSSSGNNEDSSVALHQMLNKTESFAEETQLRITPVSQDLKVQHGLSNPFQVASRTPDDDSNGGPFHPPNASSDMPPLTVTAGGADASPAALPPVAVPTAASLDGGGGTAGASQEPPEPRKPLSPNSLLQLVFGPYSAGAGPPLLSRGNTAESLLGSIGPPLLSRGNTGGSLLGGISPPLLSRGNTAGSLSRGINPPLLSRNNTAGSLLGGIGPPLLTRSNTAGSIMSVGIGPPLLSRNNTTGSMSAETVESMSVCTDLPLLIRGNTTGSIPDSSMSVGPSLDTPPPPPAHGPLSHRAASPPPNCGAAGTSKLDTFGRPSLDCNTFPAVPVLSSNTGPSITSCRNMALALRESKEALARANIQMSFKTPHGNLISQVNPLAMTAEEHFSLHKLLNPQESQEPQLQLQKDTLSQPSPNLQPPNTHRDSRSSVGGTISALSGLSMALPSDDMTKMQCAQINDKSRARPPRTSRAIAMGLSASATGATDEIWKRVIGNPVPSRLREPPLTSAGALSADVGNPVCGPSHQLLPDEKLLSRLSSVSFQKKKPSRETMGVHAPPENSWQQPRRPSSQKGVTHLQNILALANRSFASSENDEPRRSFEFDYVVPLDGSKPQDSNNEMAASKEPINRAPSRGSIKRAPSRDLTDRSSPDERASYTRNNQSNDGEFDKLRMDVVAANPAAFPESVSSDPSVLSLPITSLSRCNSSITNPCAYQIPLLSTGTNLNPTELQREYTGSSFMSNRSFGTGADSFQDPFEEDDVQGAISIIPPCHLNRQGSARSQSSQRFQMYGLPPCQLNRQESTQSQSSQVSQMSILTNIATDMLVTPKIGSTSTSGDDFVDPFESASRSS